MDANSSNRFRWAACQLDTLVHCLSYAELESALQSLPQDLDETYSRILSSIPEGPRETAIRILQFLTYSDRPLTVQEAMDAIAIPLDTHRQFDPKYRLPCPDEITRYCSSLVSLVTRRSGGGTVTELELAHFSVKEYLTSESPPEPFRRRLAEQEARSCITRCCLTYLSCLRTEEPIHEVRTQFPLAWYSAQYWMDHAKPAETVDDTAVAIMKFFKDHTAYTIWRHLFNHPWNNSPESKTACPLHVASSKGLNATVRTLLEKGADVNAQGGEYGNALQAASFGGHKEVAKMLVKKGADVNIQGGLYGNALQAASSRGHKEVAKMLLEKGADVNAQGGWYGNALQAASSGGHKEVTQMLVEKGAKPREDVEKDEEEDEEGYEEESRNQRRKSSHVN